MVVLNTVVQDLQISDSASIWPTVAYSLVLSSFLLTFGRTSDMHGGYLTYRAGLIWLFIWTLISGFSQNGLMLNICRAFQGLGTAALLPSGKMLLGSVYRPGPRKNLVFSIYGACAPIGFFFGILIAGLAGQLIIWGWYFWIGTVLTTITIITSYFTIPSDTALVRARDLKMDWKGSVLIASGVTVFTVAIIDSSHTTDRWKSALLLILGTTLLISAAYVERIVEAPLVPWYIFRIPSMAPLLLSLLLFYGSLGGFLLHASMYMEESMGATTLQTVAWYAPMAIGGCIISAIGEHTFYWLSGTILLLVAGLAWVIAPLMFGNAPEDAGYWEYILPSMIRATFGIDISVRYKPSLKQAKWHRDR
jgi:MFS family permease